MTGITNPSQSPLDVKFIKAIKFAMFAMAFILAVSIVSTIIKESSASNESSHAASTDVVSGFTQTPDGLIVRVPETKAPNNILDPQFKSLWAWNEAFHLQTVMDRDFCSDVASSSALEGTIQWITDGLADGSLEWIKPNSGDEAWAAKYGFDIDQLIASADQLSDRELAQVWSISKAQICDIQGFLA